MAHGEYTLNRIVWNVNQNYGDVDSENYGTQIQVYGA